MKTLTTNSMKKIALAFFSIIAFSVCILTASFASSRGSLVQIPDANNYYLYINREECCGCGACTQYPGFYIADDEKVWVNVTELTLESCLGVIECCPIDMFEIVKP